MDKMKSLNQCAIDISDDDIFSAMKQISGYIDITPSDFKEIYLIAYHQAIGRLYERAIAFDVMTTPVVFVQTDTSLLKTAELMAEHNISGVPVVDSDHRVRGVISEKDFLREMSHPNCHTFMGVVSQCLNNKGCVAVSLQNKKAKDIMSVPPICIQELTTMDEIADILEKKNINRLPVVDQEEKLSGIVSRGDIISHFCAIPG